LVGAAQAEGRISIVLEGRVATVTAVPTFPPVLLHLESPRAIPEGDSFSLQGWIVSSSPVSGVRLAGSAQVLALAARPDVAAALPMYPHAIGFAGNARRSAIQAEALIFDITDASGNQQWTASLAPPTSSDAGAALQGTTLARACPICGTLASGMTPSCAACDVLFDPEPRSRGQEPAIEHRLATHTNEALTAKFLRGSGVEIGAFASPMPGIKPIYVDRFAEYGGVRTKADFYGDACDLPFHPSSLDYVATSHVIEHVANPLAAFREWYRVLKPGGIIYLIAPDRRLTFDHLRELTPPEHMLQDYRHGTGPADPTHIDEFAFGVDWRMFAPETPPHEMLEARVFRAASYHQAANKGEEINIHFHTFELASLVELIELGNRHRIWPGRISILERRFAFPRSRPDGVLIVATVHKPLIERLSMGFRPRGLLPSAKRFA
jgi:SAM-dependent methyltransferase